MAKLHEGLLLRNNAVPDLRPVILWVIVWQGGRSFVDPRSAENASRRYNDFIRLETYRQTILFLSSGSV
jgi:hypothetical protein